MIAINAIKLVALDLDGTLLSRKLEILPETREAIARAHDRGVQFAIVTGRMYQSSTPFAKELGLEGMPLIAYNGALIREYPSGRIIHHDPVPLETCRALAAFCEARGLHLQAYVDDELYVPDLGPATQQYLAIARVRAHPVGSLFLWLPQPSTKLLIIDQPERIPALAAEVKELLDEAVEVHSSYPEFLEVVGRNVSKGRALEVVAASLGVAREEVMAIGDGMNDLSMIRWAGTGVAMAHAPEPVREAADYVTQFGPGEGVAEALERLVLTEE